MSADKVCAFVRSQTLKRDQRGRDTLITKSHRRSIDNAPIGYDVLISSLVRKCNARERATFHKAIPGSLRTANAKVHLKLLDCVAMTFSKPAALLGGIGEGREHNFRRLRIAAVDNKCAVNNRLVFHDEVPIAKRNKLSTCLSIHGI